MSVLAPFTHVVAAGIHFQVRPGRSDQTIVLLHGIGGHASGFAEMMRHWPEGPRLIAWDCPGYGASRPVVGEQPGPELYARALAAALDELGVATVALMGQSLGALFAGSFATHFPARVRRLVLMCPALGYKAAPGDPLPTGLEKRLADFASEGASGFAAARASRLVKDPLRKPAVVETIRASMSIINAAGHAQAVHALAQGNLIDSAAGWQHNVLLLAGAEDAITPLAGTLELFSTLRERPRNRDTHEELHVLGDSGHAVFLEHPFRVAASAAGFLGGVA